MIRHQLKIFVSELVHIKGSGGNIVQFLRRFLGIKFFLEISLHTLMGKMGLQTVAMATAIFAVLYSVHCQGPLSAKKSNKSTGVSSNTSLQKYTNVSSKKTGRTTSRQYYTSGSGWGWYDNRNLDLYTLLGGLAFLGLLTALFMYFNNQQSTMVVMMPNATGRRRRRDLSNLGEELVGQSWWDILRSLSLSVDSPWWDKRDIRKRKIRPFRLPAI